MNSSIQNFSEDSIERFVNEFIREKDGGEGLLLSLDKIFEIYLYFCEIRFLDPLGYLDFYMGFGYFVPRYLKGGDVYFACVFFPEAFIRKGQPARLPLQDTIIDTHCQAFHN